MPGSSRRFGSGWGCLPPNPDARHPSLPCKVQFHPPAGRGHEAQSLRPLHRQKGTLGQGFFLLLGKQFIGSGGMLQPIQIQMHQRRGAVSPRSSVVVGQGKGGAGDRFADAQPFRQSLHQAGFSRAQIPLQQQNRKLICGGFL